MINWVNFLHIYQPPHQNEYVLHQVARESYFEIAKFFDLYDGLKLTMNISGSLLEQLLQYRYDDLLRDFKQAFEGGEMELVGSAMYHPLLPLLPEKEIERQILLDEKIKKDVFGNAYERHGFYLPEMAYSRKVAEALDKMGFEWIILDEISFNGKLDSFNKENVYRIRGLNLKAVFRDRIFSDYFVPEKIKEMSEQMKARDAIIITATDGELYGHHHQDFYNKTREVFTDGNVKSLKVADFMQDFAGRTLEEVEPLESNWESKEEDLQNNNPFSYWNDPENVLQKKLWNFANFTICEIDNHKDDENYKISLALLDKGLSSCHFWAASGKASTVWKETIWNPDMVESGNSFFIKSIRSLRKMDAAKRMEAEKMFLEISSLLWNLHWNQFYNINC